MMEAGRLKEQIRSQKIESSDQVLLKVARASIEIVRFAVAHLPAEDTHGWPTSALQAVAEWLPSMPDATVDHQELAVTLTSFARECEAFERRRRGISSASNVVANTSPDQ